MLSRDYNKRLKETTEERKKIIDNVTRLYVSLLKNDNTITTNEINVLYSLLTNIFRKESISWEVYIRQIIDSEINQNKQKLKNKDIKSVNNSILNICDPAIIAFLNEKLSVLDKIRILLSLIIMSYSDNDFTIQEITLIIELAKKLDLETDSFMEIINAIEYKTSDAVSIKGFRHLNTIDDSIFSDFLVFGRSEECQIQFKDRSLNHIELVMFMIDKYIFIGTNNRVNSRIYNQDNNSEMQLEPFELYLVSKASSIKISGQIFNYDILCKIYNNQEIYDVIDFKKVDYDFKIINNKNRHTILLSRGTFYKNGQSIPKNKYVDLFYDDLLQIKSYANFSLIDVIRERSEIGVENINPKELFIEYYDGFFSISKIESVSTIVYIEINNNKFTIYPPKKNWDIFLNNNKISEPSQFYLNTDIITINKKNFRINNFFDLVEIPFEIEHINVLDIKHYFSDGNIGLDSISFDIQKGEIIGVMGQSGCGKSSLLKAICGEVFPTYGSVLYDGKDYFENINFYSQFVGYVPQDDLLFSNLTVYENLYYRGKLRIPKITNSYLKQKIDNILLKTNLIHRKNTKVGDLKNKLLSGGERKRLNLALELLFDPTIIICDEPTSGLSYSDAEQIIDILRSFSEQGKFVILTIHQPNTNVFHKFDKILLMDKGGKQVFYGQPSEVWTYFDVEYEQISFNKELITQKKEERLPEYVNIIIEYPEYRENGEIVYEQQAQNLMVKRKFPPEYWRDKYKRKMLFDLIQFDSMRAKSNKPPVKQRKKIDFNAKLTQFWTFFKRNLIMKLRNKLNLLITFGEAPLLGIIIAFILRLAPASESYSFNQNINIGIYIFISVIVFIFLGMSNSMEEILSERKSILREKMLNLRMTYFLGSKIGVLCLFSFMQVFLYLSVSSVILSVKGVFLIYFVYLFIASLIGSSLGVLISSFLSDVKSVINILPLILIPQIIFGGAIVEYEKMNRQLKLIDNNPIPEIVQIMPSRWIFEGLYTAQAKLNPYDKKINKIDKLRKNLVSTSNNYSKDLSDLYKQINVVNTRYPKSKYNNEYINLSVNIMDGRFLNSGSISPDNNSKRPVNVFLSSMKIIKGIPLLKDKIIPTYIYNIIIIMFFTLVINTATLLKIKYFYKE